MKGPGLYAPLACNDHLGRAETVFILLSASAYIASEGGLRRIAPMEIAYAKNLDAVQILIQAGADVCYVNEVGDARSA